MQVISTSSDIYSGEGKYHYFETVTSVVQTSFVNVVSVASKLCIIYRFQDWLEKAETWSVYAKDLCWVGLATVDPSRPPSFSTRDGVTQWFTMFSEMS